MPPDHRKSNTVYGHYQTHHKLSVGHIGNAQPRGRTDELLGTHWNISPASQSTALPMDTTSACRLALLAKKASCLVGTPETHFEAWWAADKPDCQMEVPAQNAEHA